jgi:hypothetical protein
VRRRFASLTLHRFKCSQRPHLEYKIFLKEIYDDWYYKKQSCAVFFAYHATLRRISRPSVFAPYLSSVMLFRSIFVVRHAAERTTNLRHH